MENKKPEKKTFYWEYKYDKEKFSKDIKKYIIDRNKNSHIIDLHGIPLEEVSEVLKLEDLEKILDTQEAIIVTFPRRKQEEYRKRIIELLDGAEDIHPDWDIKAQRYRTDNQVIIFKQDVINHININVPSNINILVGENSSGMTDILGRGLSEYLNNLEYQELSKIKSHSYVKKIEIKKLFGLYDYQINFEKSDICVVIAPNGCGKTTAFKIIDECLSHSRNNDQKPETYKNIYYSRLAIETANGTTTETIYRTPSMYEDSSINVEHHNFSISELHSKKYEEVIWDYCNRTKDINMQDNYRVNLFNDIMSEFFRFDKTVQLDFNNNYSMAKPLKITYAENKDLKEPFPGGVIKYGEDLPFEILSTGEQNIISIFINLIFGTKYNSFIMIDEPEISLHMEWQLLLLRNIIRVAKELELQILIATHSPYLLESNEIEIASVEYGE